MKQLLNLNLRRIGAFNCRNNKTSMFTITDTMLQKNVVEKQ